MANVIKNKKSVKAEKPVKKQDKEEPEVVFIPLSTGQKIG